MEPFDQRQLVADVLDLWHIDDGDALVGQVLPILVSLTRARQAYVEVQDEAGEPLWWRAAGCDGEGTLEQIRERTSRGIVEAARQSVEVINTASAMLDPDYAQQDSVRGYQIEAVVCAPITIQDHLVGVVYIQNRQEGGRFEPADVEVVQRIAAMLAPAVQRIRNARLADSTEDIRQRFSCDDIVGRSAALAVALREASLVAPLDVDVLITGASGTGKSMLASAIHRNSARAGGPFHVVSSGAIPDTLFESEMFGHSAGAFTSATSRQLGHIERAKGGTLFLDEISTLSPGSQVKLLEVLQSRRYAPVGGPTATADVRIVSATNDDLEALVRAGKFRADLFYRLKVLPIRMPSLAERVGDLPLLVERIVASVCAKHDLATCRPSADLVREIEIREWPGNVRQLAATLEAGVIRCSGAQEVVVTRVHAFPDLEPGGEGQARTYQSATRAFQRGLLQRTLDECDWTVADAAKLLRVNRGHLHALILQFEIGRNGPGTPAD